MSIDVGLPCFFNHPRESWVVARVTGKGPKGYAVRTDDVERKCVGENFGSVKEDKLAICREDLLDEQPDDLLSLTLLHDAVLLRCLYLRYFRDIIYTNIGAIVVAINPFNYTIPWYQDTKMFDYLQEGSVIKKNLPHSWAQAHRTYYDMITDCANQCILISGESGAGKTEAAKIVLKYLAHLSCKNATGEDKKSTMLVGAKVEACSPILECFGNARTVSNDNSSRFGKLVKIGFNTSGQLAGAETKRYLLEKSRIVTAAENERVYHSFYLLVRGPISKTLGLESETVYNNLNAGGCLQNSEFNSADDYKRVVDAMAQIGMTSEEVHSIWSCIGGIILLLNVTFEPDGEGALIKKDTEKYLKSAANLWRIDEATLRKEMLTTTLTVQNVETIKLLRPTLAVDARDALVKALYDGLFGWLVDKCNQMCCVPSEGNWIALLDIFGFENFKKNSFEQLCINLTNEALQNHYNKYIFEKDMEECVAEGVDVTGLKCPDNSACLQLIVGSGGILALLDEECTLGSGSELGFLEKLDQAHGKVNPYFEKKKVSRDTFIVHHYAASVTYDVKGWLNKNRDTLKDKVRIMMRNSQDPLIRSFLEPPLPPDMRGKRHTVSSFYKGQLAALMEVIESTNPHWIRCIKPHEAKKPLMFDGLQTMRQLESSGVLVTVKIRKIGYPVRNAFDQFNKRYKVIIGSKSVGKKGRELAQLILAECDMSTKASAQIGKTKVFMKADAFTIIEGKRNNALAKISLFLQKCGRAYLVRLCANRENCERKCRNLATLLIKEYRAYMIRSAALREARMSWQKQQIMFFQAKTDALHDACVHEKEEIYSSFFQTMHDNYTTLNEHIRWLSMRESEMQKERLQLIEAYYVVRDSIQKEAELSAIKLFIFFKQELQLFFEIISADLDDLEWERRCCISELETEERKNIWYAFNLRKATQPLSTIVNNALTSRKMIEAIEAIQREEIRERRVLERRNCSYLRSFVRHFAEIGQMARQFLRQQVLFEKARARQLMSLHELRAAEETREPMEEGPRRLNASLGYRAISGEGGGGGVGCLGGGKLYTPSPSRFFEAARFSPSPRGADLRSNKFLSSAAYAGGNTLPTRHSTASIFEKHEHKVAAGAQHLFSSDFAGRSPSYPVDSDRAGGSSLYEMMIGAQTTLSGLKGTAQSSTSALSTINTRFSQNCHSFQQQADPLNARVTICGAAQGTTPLVSQYKRSKRWA